MEKLGNIINSIMSNKGANLVPSLTDQTRLREDLGFDSFDLAELTVHIEEVFGVDIFEDGLVANIGEIRAKLGIK